MPLSYDLTPFQILGQNLSNFFVAILVRTMTPKRHFEINWPLPVAIYYSTFHMHSCKYFFPLWISSEFKKMEYIPYLPKILKWLNWLKVTKSGGTFGLINQSPWVHPIQFFWQNKSRKPKLKHTVQSRFSNSKFSDKSWFRDSCRR